MATRQEIDILIQENRRRQEEIFGTYDPITGVGCYGYPDKRVKVTIPDFFIKEMWIPMECLDNLLFRNLIRYGSIEMFCKEYYPDKAYTQQLHKVVSLSICRARFYDDPEFAMYMNDRIVDKITGDLIPFKLRYAQRKLLNLMESLRHEGKPIYVVLLKARQWGGSTLVQMYIKWMQDYRHPNGWNAIILSQALKTSKKIKAMYRTAIDNQPGWTIGKPNVKLQMAPFEGSMDDFIVSDGVRALRSSTLSIASFENFDSVRGSNFHCAHYSEVAYWKQTPEHDPEAVISSISGGILNQPDNIEVFESTGRGAAGFFYDKCQMAMNTDNNDAYKFLFIPFYLIENDMQDVDDEKKFARWLFDNKDKNECPAGYRETGKFFWKMWELGATFQAINWYRNTRNKYKSHAYMATEAPIDEVEAFRNSGNLVFNPYSIDDLRRSFKKDPIYYADVVLPTFTRKSREIINNANVVIRDDGIGELKIWAQPNNNILKIKNRYLVAVDIGGNSPTSDFTVMTVLDLMGMMPGMSGRMSVVARWRSHCRHDILAWKAAALAHYYDDALLVIESNTADREKNNNTEGDHFGTIIEEIANYYRNLYQRTTGPEAVVEQVTQKYGFQTNKLTKGWIIDNLIACVDDMLWDEPDEVMYRELSYYERKEDGSMGNKEGATYHDDVLMSTAIALWVALNEAPKPQWIVERERKREKVVLTEASI